MVSQCRLALSSERRISLRLRVKFDLVDGRNVVTVLKQPSKVFDGDVRNTWRAELRATALSASGRGWSKNETPTDGFDLIRVQLLYIDHRLPRINPINILVRLRIFCHRRRPMHEPKIQIRGIELLQRAEQRLLGVSVVRVVQLGGQEDIFSFHAGSFDPLSNLGLVAVGSGGVDVSIPSVLERVLDGMLDLPWFGLAKKFRTHQQPHDPSALPEPLTFQVPSP